MKAKVEKKTGGDRAGVRFGTLVVSMCVAMLLVGVAIAGAGFYVSNNFKQSGTRSETLMSSMRTHMTAEVLLDSMRGVVLRSLYAGSRADFATVKATATQVQEYAGEFRAAIDKQATLDVPASVRDALDGVKEPLEAYIASAVALVDQVNKLKMIGAQKALPAFDETFEALAADMGAVSDAIEAANVQQLNAAEGDAQL